MNIRGSHIVIFILGAFIMVGIWQLLAQSNLQHHWFKRYGADPPPPHTYSYSWVRVNNTWTLLINNLPFHSSRTEILTKLAGRNIVFVGDSLMRYQYLNLVYFLARGSWVSPIPSNENEQQWRTNLNYSESWKKFFFTVATDRLTTATTYELCDCIRMDGVGRDHENRYYRDIEFNISINFYSFTPARASPRGQYYHQIAPPLGCHPGRGECRQSFCDAGSCPDPPVNGWNTSNHIIDLFSKILSLTKVDTVVIGDRYISYHSAEVRGQIAKLAKMAKVERLIWKRRPPPTNRTATNQTWCNDISAAHLVNIANQGWVLYDFYPALCELSKLNVSYQSDVGWDRFHYQQPINTAFNYALLETTTFL